MARKAGVRVVKNWAPSYAGHSPLTLLPKVSVSGTLTFTVSPTDANGDSMSTLWTIDGGVHASLAGAGTSAPGPEVGHVRSPISTAASSITSISLFDE